MILRRNHWLKWVVGMSPIPSILPQHLKVPHGILLLLLDLGCHLSSPCPNSSKLHLL
uniref:Uncharacterized protein n=1 Tax=Rhizophora mucronata TaxID=61149 RepID=A0A2P2Q8Z7_RHIMU